MLTQRHSKALEYLTKIQASSSSPSKRAFEEAVLLILSQPENQWKDIARRHGLVFGPDLYQRLKLLKEEGHEDFLSTCKDRAPELQSIVDFMIMEETKTDFDRLILEKFQNVGQYKVSDRVFFGTEESLDIHALIRPIDKGAFKVS